MADQEIKKPLEKMTAKELREMALAMGDIVGVHGMNKLELVAAIKEAKGIKDEAGNKKDVGSIRAMKAKLKALKAQRDELRAGDADGPS